MVQDVRTQLFFRWWTLRDLEILVPLFAESFPDERWTARDFRRFGAHTEDDNINCLRILAHRQKLRPLYGALLYTLTPHECRIRRLVVVPEHRRCGLGRSILRHLVDPASLIRRDHFAARVHEANLPGLLFFRDALPEPTVFTHTHGDRDQYADGQLGYWFRLYRPMWNPQPITAEV